MAQTPVAQMQCTVFGRVEAVTKKQTSSGDLFLTLIKTPAPDAYSPPGTFEIKSKKRLGGQGDEISVLCDLRGYSRSYENKDGATVRTAEAVLQAVQ